jgi:hypothetical protein
VKVAGNQCPGITGCFGLSQNPDEAIEKIVPVAIAKKGLLPSDSTPDDMMHRVRAIYSCFPRQAALYHIHPLSKVII